MIDATTMPAPPSEQVGTDVEKKLHAQAGAQELIFPSRLMEQFIQAQSEIDKQGKGLLEVGTLEQPAHAFRIVFPHPPEGHSSHEVYAEILTFIEERNLGFVLRAREGEGGYIKGMVMPSESRDLATIFGELDYLADDLEKKFHTEALFLISSMPELQVMALHPSRGHYPLEAVQAAGFTNIALAGKALKSDTEGNQYLYQSMGSRVHLVTPPRLSDILNNPSFADLFEKLSPGQTVPMPSGKAQGELLIHPLPKGTYAESLPLEATQSQHEVQVDIQEDIAVGDVSTGFMNKFAPENWMVQMKEQGFVTFQLEGSHTVVKFDFSGMSKMVAQGIRGTGKLVLDVLYDFAKHSIGTLDSDTYAFGIEGDALILFIPGSPTNKLAAIIEKIASAGEHFSRTAQAYGGPDTKLKLHDVGMKTVIANNTDPVAITVFPGGLVTIENPLLSRNEDVAESLAKAGGYTASVISQHRFTPKDYLSTFGTERVSEVPLDDGSYVYLLTPYKTALEVTLSDFITSRPPDLRPRFEARYQKMCAYIEALRSSTDSDFNMMSYQNNEIAITLLLATFPEPNDMEGFLECISLDEVKRDLLTLHTSVTTGQNVNPNSPDGRITRLYAYLMESFSRS